VTVKKWGVVCLLAAVSAAAEKRADIRVESRLVLIPVSVTDARNHAVTGLGRDAFRIFDGKAEQRLTSFAIEDAPVSIGIVFDSSGSMRDKLREAREAVSKFVAGANPEDEFFLTDFSSASRVSVPFTGNPGEVQSRLLAMGSEGRTALLDAVCLSLDYMRNATHPRRALLVISDGGDNFSRYSENEILRRVRETDVRIYTVGVYHRGALMLPEGDHGETLMQTMAEESGGRHFAVEKPSELPGIAEEIALELRSQYVLGYQPSEGAGGGKYHRVQVKVSGGRDLRANWRRGYFERQ
jgi:VWFA-related protein